jgi:hypothetical protein
MGGRTACGEPHQRAASIRAGSPAELPGLRHGPQRAGRRTRAPSPARTRRLQIRGSGARISQLGGRRSPHRQPWRAHVVDHGRGRRGRREWKEQRQKRSGTPLCRIAAGRRRRAAAAVDVGVEGRSRRRGGRLPSRPVRVAPETDRATARLNLQARDSIPLLLFVIRNIALGFRIFSLTCVILGIL